MSLFREERWFVESLAKGLDVIATFGATQSAQTVSEVAARAGISRASSRRLLMTLEALGYLAKDNQKRYVLTPRILGLGTAYLSSHVSGDGVQPILERLREFSGRSASLSVLDGTDIVYVARAGMPGPLRFKIDVGQRLPAYATAMGRVLLSGLDEAELDVWLASAAFEPLTEVTVRDAKKLREIVLSARAQGYCSVEGELAPGIRVLAVPVMSRQNEVMAALNCTTQSWFERGRDDQKELLPEMQRAASEISGVWNHFHLRTSREVLERAGRANSLARFAVA